MSIVNRTIAYIKRPITLFDKWSAEGRLNWMPDKWYISLMFRSRMGYWMDWHKPKTYSEKLQWLKIYDRNPLYTQLADKYEVRKYVAEKIGDEYLIPLLGTWNSIEEINFEQLPNQFVLKCTHDSGSVIICKDKQSFDFDSAKTKLEQALNRNYYFHAREWPYKNIRPRIIAEPFLSDHDAPQPNSNTIKVFDNLSDFKFFCFHGKPIFMYVSHDRAEHPTTDFFDMDYKKLSMKMKDPNSTIPPQKSPLFEDMKKLAAILSHKIPHVRVDFYTSKNRIYFGEMTFFHNAGFAKIKPSSWNDLFGKMI